MFASNDTAATVTPAISVANSGIDVDDPAAATRSDGAASSMMLGKGKRNKNGSKDIDIQACNVILQLGVGCRLMHHKPEYGGY